MTRTVLRWERLVGERGGVASAADLHALGLSDDDGRLHIELRRSDVLRVPADRRHLVRVHWTRNPSPGGKAVVSRAAAQRQALACRPW